MALNVAVGKWLLLNDQEAERVPFYNNSGGTLAEGTLVNMNGSGVVAACGDANTVGAHGVVAANVADSANGVLIIAGHFECGVEGSVTFVQGQRVYSFTAGEVDDGSSGDRAVGKIVKFPAANATTVEVLLWSLFYHDAITVK